METLRLLFLTTLWTAIRVMPAVALASLAGMHGSLIIGSSFSGDGRGDNSPAAISQ